MQHEGKDVWASGHSYEPYVGRWSRLVAAEFLDWLALPPLQAWLDVGCGTGALSQAILQRCDPSRVLGLDPSEGFIAYATAHALDRRATFQVGDAQALPAGSDEFGAAVAGLVINFVPDQAKAVREMVRAVGQGGVVAAYVWDYAGEMQMMRRFWDAAVALKPVARPLDEGVRFPICHPDLLQALFENAVLADVRVRSIDVPTVFHDFDDFWSPFLSGQAPAPGYCMSLSPNEREQLRQALDGSLKREADGSIRLTARAWAVKGTVGTDPPVA
jgi:SAM-dependent methyltransferase